MPGDAGTFLRITCWPHIADWYSLATLIVVARITSAGIVALGFSRFVRGVKWRYNTLGGKVRGSEAPMATEKAWHMRVFLKDIDKPVW